MNYKKAMDSFLGPLNWRPTNEDSEDLSSDPASQTRNAISSDPAVQIRNSIFSPAPAVPEQSQSPAPVFSPSKWPTHSNPWSKKSYQSTAASNHWMKSHHPHVQQFRSYMDQGSGMMKWRSYLNSQRGSLWA